VVRYRALVTDINLNGRMNGWKLAKQDRKIEPSFPYGQKNKSIRKSGNYLIPA
jgi:hypothetical protein